MTRSLSGTMIGWFVLNFILAGFLLQQITLVSLRLESDWLSALLMATGLGFVAYLVFVHMLTVRLLVALGDRRLATSAGINRDV